MAALTGEAQAAVVRANMDDAIGRAIAAVLFDKAPEAVTPEEAAAALADPGPPADGRPREVRAALTHRAIRAGILEAVTKLTPERLPPVSHPPDRRRDGRRWTTARRSDGRRPRLVSAANPERGRSRRSGSPSRSLSSRRTSDAAATMPSASSPASGAAKRRPKGRSIADPAMERIVRGPPKTLEAGRDDRPKRDRGS